PHAIIAISMLHGLKRPYFFTRLSQWTRQHKKASLAIAGGVLLLSVSAGTFALLSQKPPEPQPEPVATKPKPEPEPEPIKHYSILTGEQVANESDLTAPVTAIMIENSPDARPQSGLKDAGVVYEAIA